MRMGMCLLCGHLVQPDQRKPGWYTCARCGNQFSASRPQLSDGFIIAVLIVALLVSAVCLFWLLWIRPPG